MIVNTGFFFVYMKLAAYIPNRNDMKGDCGLGHLTFKGYKQQELNGQNLRKAYVDTGFLSPNYNVHEDFFRTDGKLVYFTARSALPIPLDQDF